MVARGLEAYEAGSYEEAATLFFRASEDRAASAPHEIWIAQYFLAKALFHLSFFHVALGVIEEIHEDPDHPFLPQTVTFLAVLFQHFPNEQHVLRQLHHHAVRDIPEPVSADERMTAYLSFLRGKAAYHQSDLTAARRYLASVGSRWRWSVEARFYQAMIAVRERRTYEALRAFQDMGHSSIQQEQCGVSERRALRDLAALSIGRLLYSGAQTENAFRAALRAYAGVGAESPHRSQATFERAWVHFQLGEDERALVLLDSLPELFVRVTPECTVLRATIALARCDLDQAQQLTSDFRPRWEPIAVQLRALDSREQPRSLPSRETLAGELVHHVMESRLNRRSRDCLERVEEEITRLNEVQLERGEGSISEFIESMIAATRAVERDNFENQLGSRFLRQAMEVEDLIEEMERLEQGVADIRRGTTTCEQF
jgi:hypothetical protein